MSILMSVLWNDGDDSDWTLDEAAQSVWITVGNASVHIRNAGSHLGVDVYPRFRENDDPVGTIWIRQPEPATDEEGHQSAGVF